jgi:hypothetical protein
VIYLIYFVFYLVALNGAYTFILGTQESAQWNPEGGFDNSPSVVYSYEERKTIVRLQCGDDKSDEFEFLGQEPIGVFTWRLKHKCACWNGCSSE